MKNIADRMTPEEYGEYVKKKTPGSHLAKDCIKAFLIGGAICALGQGFLNLYKYLGVPEDQASTLVTVTMVFLGTFLTGLNVYPKLAKHAGAGTLVPITGFANSMVSPALEFKSEGFVTGLGAKLFSVAGPVLVFGITASVVYGLILWIVGVVL